jgi:hypothetical protein
LIWWLTADGVMQSSSAATAKLECLAAIWKVLMAFNEGLRISSDEPSDRQSCDVWSKARDVPAADFA